MENEEPEVVRMEPWEDPNGPWESQAAFFTWLRGNLRKAWTRYPIKNKALRSDRFRAPIGKGGREVWACKCARCGGTFTQSRIQVDHIVPAGNLNNWGDVGEFAKRLFTTTEGLRLLCKCCHEIVTYAHLNDMDEVDVPDRLKVVAFSQMVAGDQRKTLLDLGLEPGKNRKERVGQYEHYIQTKEKDEQMCGKPKHT